MSSSLAIPRLDSAGLLSIPLSSVCARSSTATPATGKRSLHLSTLGLHEFYVYWGNIDQAADRLLVTCLNGSHLTVEPTAMCTPNNPPVKSVSMGRDPFAFFYLARAACCYLNTNTASSATEFCEPACALSRFSLDRDWIPCVPVYFVREPKVYGPCI
ncbi:hypothetical protein C8R45DRAFT_931634 [Mycena sanguinolenta]|nr:hypothetical protein C8R45DRAFT_931634 [Mycena sanguinolenta]